MTGFEPFGGETRNPSAEVLSRLPERVGGAELEKLLLPVALEACDRALAEAVRAGRPDVVLSVGQAGGRAAVTVERMAVNLDDFSIPDNAGSRPTDRPIDPAGPDGYLTNLPVKAMAAAIRAAGIPAEVSMTAGTYLCNHVLYTARRLTEPWGGRCGFLHIPYLPEQAAAKPGQPSMSLELSLRAVEAAIAAIAAVPGN